MIKMISIITTAVMIEIIKRFFRVIDSIGNIAGPVGSIHSALTKIGLVSQCLKIRSGLKF